MARGKGGGPKTAAGKLASSRNSLKHGYRSAAPVLPWVESESEWLAFRERIVAAVGPWDAVSEELAGVLALNLWRLRRGSRFEQESLEGAQATINNDLLAVRIMDGTTDVDSITPEQHERYEKLVMRWLRQRVVPDERHLERLIRFENHVSKQVYRALWELRLMRKFRDEAAPGKRWVEVNDE